MDTGGGASEQREMVDDLQLRKEAEWQGENKQNT